MIASHHKCTGRRNFWRSLETLALLLQARHYQLVALDMYPYTACSTVLNAEMVEQSFKAVITWCDPHPEVFARDLNEIARTLGCTTTEAVRKLQPAGALYVMMDEADVTSILCSPNAMIGSDGLPEDEHPHPRL